LIEDGELSIGTIRAAFGVEGFLTVSSHSGEYKHFKGLTGVTLLIGGKRRPAVVDATRVTGKGILVRFKGLDTPEAARSLVGAEILVPRSAAAPLAAGQCYVVDIVGGSLLFKGKEVAKILSVVEGGQYDLFESELPDGRVVLVPYSKEFIGDVDVPRRRVELLLDWILE
jgi:16S rRNA processing protein RimM